MARTTQIRRPIAATTPTTKLPPFTASLYGRPSGVPGFTIGDLCDQVKRLWSPVYAEVADLLTALEMAVAALPLPDNSQDQVQESDGDVLGLATAGAYLARLAACGGISPHVADAIDHQWDAVDDVMRALVWEAGQVAGSDGQEVAA